MFSFVPNDALIQLLIRLMELVCCGLTVVKVSLYLMCLESFNAGYVYCLFRF